MGNKRIVTGDAVVAFVEAALDIHCKPDRLGVGLQDGDEMVAGVVFDQRWEHDVTVSAVLEAGSVTRAYRQAVFRFAFEGLGVRRITLAARRQNAAAISASLRLGFKHEGMQRGGYRNGDDRMMFGMLKQECRWLSSR